jgi:hypothetical protein
MTPLGTAPDAVIAREEGVSREAIRQRRTRAGIKPFAPKAPRKSPKWIALLGTMPDRELARASGVHRTMIRNRRIEKGIPAFVPPSSAPCDATTSMRIPPDIHALLVARLYPGETVGSFVRSAVTYGRPNRSLVSGIESGGVLVSLRIPAARRGGQRAYLAAVLGEIEAREPFERFDTIPERTVTSWEFGRPREVTYPEHTVRVCSTSERNTTRSKDLPRNEPADPEVADFGMGVK